MSGDAQLRDAGAAQLIALKNLFYFRLLAEGGVDGIGSHEAYDVEGFVFRWTEQLQRLGHGFGRLVGLLEA